MWIQTNKTDNALTFTNNQTGDQITCSKIYEHKELGVFYVFDNLLQMPMSRKYVFDLAQQMEKIGIEKDELADKMKSVMELIRKREQGFELEVYSIANTVHNHVKGVWDYQKTAVMVAAVMIIQEGENIGHFSQQEAERKIEAWGRDAGMLGFFLNIVTQKCSKVNNSFANFTHLFSESLPPSKENWHTKPVTA